MAAMAAATLLGRARKKPADAAPRDRMRAAVDLLIAYDAKRRTALLDTLERYLAERRSVIETEQRCRRAQ